MYTEKLFNLIKILLVLVFVMLLVFVIQNPKKTQTNILRAILSNSEKDELLIDLSQRHSGKFNVIIQSDDRVLIEEAQKAFENGIAANNVKTDISKTPDAREARKGHKVYSANLVAPQTAMLLEKHDYGAVKFDALERLYSPISINLLPIEEDPFLFFTDYLQSLGAAVEQGVIDYNGSYYKLLSYSLADSIALSPSLLNKEIKKVVKQKNTLEKQYKNVKVYLSGSPIHTYYASSKSMIEINVISILSFLFIMFLCKFYFRTFKILIPITLSLIVGISAGYMLTAMFFDSIHILTFVFSTTLIGICVDYSLHFFAHNCELKSIIKSLTISMLTTVSAFLILLLSNIQLLQQISVFTAGGLLSVYLFVVMFYPMICPKILPNIPQRYDLSRFFEYQLSDKYKKIIIGLCIFAGIIGLIQVRFNDDIRDMYNPPKYLVESEKLNSNLTGQGASTLFLIVKGNDVQDILRTEESVLKNIPPEKYVALSKFVPSIDKQKRNLALKKELYKNELNSFAKFISTNARYKLLNEKPRMGYLVKEKLPLPILKELFLYNNATVVLLKDIDAQSLKRAMISVPNVTCIDLKNDVSKKVRDCRVVCLKLILPICMFLFASLAFVYKPKNAFKILLPSICGGLFSLAMLGLFNQNINLFHILALFLIVGFSLDYSVFRFNNCENSFDSQAAVMISCATSTFSFFLLSITSFKLISSLGFVLTLGLVCSYVFSILLIPLKNETKQEIE